MPKETTFRTNLVKEIKQMLGASCVIIKTNPSNQISGLPDVLILYKDTWGALETKKSEVARKGPNQEFYIKMLNRLSYASFVYPENKEEVLRELQQALRRSR